ncbi:hypothetical protein B7486_58260, partial [cyanobacterium TDX16]
MTPKTAEASWRADLLWYLAIVVLVGVAFGVGQGPMAGLLAAAGMLLFTAVLALGRRRSDALRVAGGAGDERNRQLYTRALATAGGLLGLVVTGWFLVTVAQGDADQTLLVLTLLFSTT